MSELPWFKVYPEALHDPKFIVAATDNQMDEMTVFGIWMALLCIAARSPIRGKLVASNNRNYTIEQLDIIIGWEGTMGTGDLGSLMESLMDLDMISVDEDSAYCIKNFDVRQETKEERNKRLNRERQKRYKDSHKFIETVTDNVTNNAPITQDSISISISNSLIKDSLTEKALFSIDDAAKLICEVAQWTSLPTDWMDCANIVLDMIQHYGLDDTRNRLVASRDDWTSRKRKENGENYRLSNKQWINNAMSGERVGARPPMTDEEAYLKASEELRRKIK